MKAHLVRRLRHIVPTVFVVTLIAFALGSLAPGDAAFTLLEQQLGEPPSQAQVDAFRDEEGLNDPIVVQYGRWLVSGLTGDLGTSYWTGKDVTTALLDAFPVTAQLALLGFVLSILGGVPLGLWVAIHRHRATDHATRFAALGAASLPNFWIGYLLIILFAVRLGILPSQGVGSPVAYVLPAVTLALPALGMILRLTRASALEILGDPLVTACRARGLAQSRIMVRHVLRLALNPVVTYSGLLLGGLLGGTVIVETVFGMPGIGRLVVEAINRRDIAVVQGFIIYFGVLVIMVSFVVDMIYGLLDPRVRLGEASVPNRAQ